jgi:endo-1,4-beta-D-glucanase Y
MRIGLGTLSCLVLVSMVGCSASSSGTGPTGSNLGGSGASGGSTASTGGANAGGPSTGGAMPTGGASVGVGGTGTAVGATGGTNANATGGKPATGGSTTVNPGTGGTSIVGSATGGLGNTGGRTATGGSATGANTGGATGATGGASPTGGSKAGGGTSSAAGAPNTGGVSTAGSTSTSSYYGFQGVPTSANQAAADPAAWYASWKTTYVADCGSNGQARVKRPQNNNDTVSEGIGYGMLLAVGNNDQTTLDKFWAYYKAHEDTKGLMNWQIADCNAGQISTGSAADGDEDAAMALVQADAKWGGYKTDATTLINAIKKSETVAGPPSYVAPGDSWGATTTTNPSYFAPGYWRAWATYVNDTFWNQLATDAYTALAAYQKLTISNSTGALVPNWGTIQGASTDSNYGYDACRTPWRVATDYVWFGTAAALTFLQNVSTYVDNQGGVCKVPFDKNSAFYGPFALSGMAVSQAKATSYLNDWLTCPNADDTQYFQGTLRGLFLLLANRQFPKGI